MSAKINKRSPWERTLGVIGLLLIGAIGMLADLSAGGNVRTVRRKATRAIARAALACVMWVRHDDITRPRPRSA